MHEENTTMTTSCTIDCTVNSTQDIEIESAHSQIEVLSTSELSFSLDTENNETVIFTVPDFVYQGDDYEVAVDCTEGGSSTSTTWSRVGSASVSPAYSTEVELDLEIVATEPRSGSLSGGGIIRIRTKGKPDLRTGAG